MLSITRNSLLALWVYYVCPTYFPTLTSTTMQSKSTALRQRLQTSIKIPTAWYHDDTIRTRDPSVKLDNTRVVADIWCGEPTHRYPRGTSILPAPKSRTFPSLKVSALKIITASALLRETLRYTSGFNAFNGQLRLYWKSRADLFLTYLMNNKTVGIHDVCWGTDECEQCTFCAHSWLSV